MSIIGKRVELVNPDYGFYSVRGKWLGIFPSLSSYSYIITSSPENGILLIDTCGAGSGKIILEALKEIGFSLSDVTGIAITHWHCDHTGSLDELLSMAADSGSGRIKVFMHSRDYGIYQGCKGRFIRFHPLIRFPMYHRPGRFPVKGDFEFVEFGDGSADNPLKPWGLEFIHVPGHTPGNTSFYHPESGALFSGSGLLLSGEGTVGISPVFYNRREQLDSGRFLMNMDFRYLYPAHMRVRRDPIPREKRIYSGRASLRQRLTGFYPLFEYGAPDVKGEEGLVTE